MDLSTNHDEWKKTNEKVLRIYTRTILQVIYVFSTKCGSDFSRYAAQI